MANYSNVPIPIAAKVIDEETHKMVGSTNVLTNKRLDLQIFGFFQVNSKLIDAVGYDDDGNEIDTKVRYILKRENTQKDLFEKFKKYLEDYNKKVVREEDKVKICSLSTFRTRLKDLKMYQMIIDSKIMIGNVQEPVYKIQTQFNIFQYVPKHTMEQLAYGTNSSTIKIYGYLLNKYKMAGEGTDVIFTSAELMRLLGLSETHTENFKFIKSALYTLEVYGLLEYCCWVEKNDGELVQRKRIIKMGVDLRPVGHAFIRAYV